MRARGGHQECDSGLQQTIGAKTGGSTRATTTEHHPTRLPVTSANRSTSLVRCLTGVTFASAHVNSSSRLPIFVSLSYSEKREPVRSPPAMMERVAESVSLIRLTHLSHFHRMDAPSLNKQKDSLTLSPLPNAPLRPTHQKFASAKRKHRYFSILPAQTKFHSFSFQTRRSNQRRT